jgi:hypothetical protein
VEERWRRVGVRKGRERGRERKREEEREEERERNRGAQNAVGCVAALRHADSQKNDAQ